jgi:hypothetical protein
MNHEVPAPGVNERLVQTTLKQNIGVTTEQELTPERFHHASLSETNASQENDPVGDTGILEQANQLNVRAKLTLMRRLMTQLEVDQIQSILEFGLREIGERHRRGTAIAAHNTRLLLKKDYSYQERGLSEPTQYYVYLRRRQPKLDRYIGTLFYVPQGCALSYFLDAEGRIIFNPPHNLFQLRDSTNPELIQLVRLICLQPPPSDYTFTKQQNDTPEIYLHLEYLDLKTQQILSKQAYPFPVCMHESGRLDRYRWEVEAVTVEPASPAAVSVASTPSDAAATPPPRRVLELPATKPLTFYLTPSSDPDVVLKRMRLWVTWSEKAMPQSKWEVIQNGSLYSLMNAHFKRRILQFASDRRCITLEHSLPVLTKWFHDLSLAVSQAADSKQYSAAQLKLARTLFVDMSLPQTESLVVLKKLFGVEFRTNPD